MCLSASLVKLLLLNAFFFNGVFSLAPNLRVSRKSSPLVTERKSMPSSKTVQSSHVSLLSLPSSGRIRLTLQSLRKICGIEERYFASVLFCLILSPVDDLSESPAGVSTSLETEDDRDDVLG